MLFKKISQHILHCVLFIAKICGFSRNSLLKSNHRKGVLHKKGVLQKRRTPKKGVLLLENSFWENSFWRTPFWRTPFWSKKENSFLENSFWSLKRRTPREFEGV